ncbi:MAG: D-glycerate dehydrogenase, partial [Candidatus Wildermuthbacteria bacterium]|nr:D-glycerate dehydrogenase [Candidatus Wildermuthbacteria bacterium]
MPRVFVSKHAPEKAVQLLQSAGFEVEVGDMKKARNADALFSLVIDRIDAKLMEASPQLKVVSNMAVGLDNIDQETAKQRGIVVKNTPDVLTESVAEHAVLLILGITRKVGEAHEFMKRGKFKGWDPALFLGTELKGKTLGLVGHGRIGCRTAEIMQKGFEMRVIYYDALRDQAREEQCGITYVSLEQLLQEADVVSLHVPLLPTTKHLIGEKELRLMKPTSYIVNTARGAVIDERALAKALKERVIQGAALDVFEEEPRITKDLLKLENVLLTPHIASATNEAR